ncbi:MAG: hypothetical protein QGH24_05015 [Candidatus Marinimicrobia bacterium]|nr:hypothetical protein [Candidatus Neomarinimicrobiota bacterium]
MKLYFDIRDVLRAPRLALSGKKIMIMLTGTLIGYALYWLFTALSFILSGISLGQMWADYGIYPCLVGVVDSAPWYACAVFDIGVLLLFFSISLACTAVSRVTYKQLKGDEFFSSSDSFKYVKKHWTAVIMAPVSIALIITFFLVFSGIFALFGKIPYVGEFLFSIPYLFYFLGALFTIYTGIVFIVSLHYTPAIVGASEEDTMGAVFQSYSITWSQPWRILLYHGALLPLLVIGVHIFKWFMTATFSLINYVFACDWFMGDKLTRIVSYSYENVYPSFIHKICASFNCVCTCINNFCCSCLSFAPFNDGGDLSSTEMVSAVILSCFLFLIVLSVVSYGLSILSVAETLMFVIFKKKSDDDNLLERKDEDELEDEEDNDFDTNDNSDDDESADSDDGDGVDESDGDDTNGDSSEEESSD